ncbi:MAG: TIGR03032 family protein [Elainellaceae cyanobacterium]
MISSQSLAIELTGSRQIISWLNEQCISFICTTYQTNRLLLIGVNSEGNLSGFERYFDRAMGVYVANPQRFYMSSRYQIWQFDQVLQPDQTYGGYDKLYVPRIGYTTGDLDVHDIALDKENRLIFISSLLNSIATLSSRHSCIPLWHPPFISKIINEDRCHLNGIAMVNGQPRYATACSQSNIIDSWRDRRHDGGCVIDMETNEIVVNGLSMPHSPRVYNNRLWLLNSGTGELGYVDEETGTFEAIAFCPGYLRGLAFWKHYAIVGLSKSRGDEKTFSGLMLDEKLTSYGAEARCGLMVININTGSIVQWLRLEGIVTELYDVQILPETQQPMALGFQTDEIAQLLTIEQNDS